jgi:hypothetical protein
MTAQVKFPHRVNLNGTHDSICRVCLATIATVKREADLAEFEARHVCDPVRVYQINQGAYVARRAIYS